jgi:serine/threonine-protein kinase
MVAAVLVGSAATAFTWMVMRQDRPPVVRAEINASGPTALAATGLDRDLAITADGSRIVYRGGNNQLFVRGLDQLVPTTLTGLGNPHGPFLSPDGQWVGFFDGNALLKKVAISGGSPVALTKVSAARGATWGENDTIIFATADNGETGLLQVAALGGQPLVLTKPSPEGDRTDHWWPEFLPGGQGVLFTIVPLSGGLENALIAVLDLRTKTETVLVRGGSHAFYAPTGHLVYGVGGTLRAVPFDLTRLAVTGTPAPVVERVATTRTGAVDAVMAANSMLVYLSGDATGAPSARRTLVWVDRQGREELLPAPPQGYRGPRLSPDGTRVAVGRDDDESDLWLHDLERATLTRLTFDPAGDTTPIWTTDGRQLVFASNRSGQGQNVYIQAADGTGSAVRLTDTAKTQAVTSITPDGTQVLVSEDRRDIGLLTLPPSLLGKPMPPRASDSEARDVGKVEPLLATRFEERWGIVSPDGRWMAYESNSSGRFEIYVRPFPAVGEGQWQVSTGGGVQALWARDGRELFYVAPDGSLFTVPVDVSNTAWRAGIPSKLFSGPYYRGDANQVGRHYDVTANGRRFLMLKEAGSDLATAPQNLIIVQHFDEELKRLVPTQ